MTSASASVVRDSRVTSRGTILVATNSRPFADIVGEMISEIGYTAAFVAAREPVWRSLGRTQPMLVICDCDASVQTIERLVAETTSRRIPLLLTEPRPEQRVRRTLSLPEGVAHLALPTSREEFSRTIDNLMAATTVS